MMNIMDEVGKIHPFIQGDFSQIEGMADQYTANLSICSRRIGLQDWSKLRTSTTR